METGEDELKRLNRLAVPAARVEARRRAVGASLLAFDRAQAETKSAAPAQGTSVADRLRSIVASLKGTWIMDIRRAVPAGTAVLALLILAPLGYQAYTSGLLLGTSPAPTVTAPAKSVAETEATVPPAAPAVLAETAKARDANTPAPAATSVPATGGALAQAQAPLAKDEIAAASKSSAVAAPVQPLESAANQQESADLAVMPRPAAPPVAAAENRAMPAAEPMAKVAAVAPNFATAPSGDVFRHFDESAQKAVATDPVSTFSLDVDTASYAYVRRSLNAGSIPAPDAVRIEEMINYFPYDYPAPSSAETPFKPTISVFPTPWNSKTELLQIGIKGYAPPVAARRPANLVFLIDTSGSMDEPDKLPLLKRALGLLVSTLGAKDTVAIVAYAGSAGVVLEPTSGSDKTKIMTALDHLEAGGSTAGAEGIELAYQLAAQHGRDGNSRVILATDGDFNVGISDPDQLTQFIKAKRQSGIALSVLGFGEGNLEDATMQALAQNGDGNASYIDSLSEAQKVLVKEAGSTLDTIAKDVKVQVEFNPATVSSYRLIGYETRGLNREDFNNDRVDAGDVGAGHTVTALYEITPAGSGAPAVDPLRYGTDGKAGADDAAKSSELADVKLRYKLPGEETSRLIEQPVTPGMVVTDIAKASDDARWAAAVAAFGQKLKGSDYAGTMSYEQIRALAAGARGNDPDGYRSEFLGLVSLAGSLSGTGGAGK